MNKKLIAVLLICGVLLSGCTIGNITFGTSYIPPKEVPAPLEYEVLNVGQYMETRTNGYGAILEQELAYYFTYIDEKGNLCDDTISHSKYGLCKVCIGEENKYVIEHKGVDTYRYLYLTEETLRGMSNYEKRN